MAYNGAKLIQNDGSDLKNLNASQLTSGTIPVARLPQLSVQRVVVLNTSEDGISITTEAELSTYLATVGVNSPFASGKKLEFFSVGDIISAVGLEPDGTYTLYDEGSKTSLSSGWLKLNAGAGVTAVSLDSSAEGLLNVSSPTGAVSISLDTQSANGIFAGPSSGGAATPTFRSLVLADTNAMLAAGDVLVGDASGNGAVANIGSPGPSARRFLIGTTDGAGLPQAPSFGQLQFSDLQGAVTLNGTNHRENVRVVASSGAVTVSTSDYIVVVNKSSGEATTVNLPATPVTGTVYVIKDGRGDADVNNITIDPDSTTQIDGALTLVIGVPYGAAKVVYNGTQWNAI